MTNITIAGNRTASRGGGILIEESSPRLRNTIIWGNDANQSANLGTSVSNPIYNTTLVEGIDLTGEGMDNLDGQGDPRFVAPVDPDLAPTSSGNYRLQAASVAIDVGNDAFLDETQDTVPDLNGDGDEDDVIGVDLLGNVRQTGVAVDLGALEFAGSTTTTQQVYLPLVVR